MSTFLDRAKKNQDDKRLEKDPADPSGAKEPDWNDPDAWGQNPDDRTTNNDDQEHGDGSGPTPEASAPKTPRRPPRRRGRPRGPEREMLSVRILAANDRRLTVAVEQTGLNPQTLVDQALEAMFRKLKVDDPGVEQVEDTA
ncbi:hypothetical protein ACH4KT_37955 [Streptomyces anulatus]